MPRGGGKVELAELTTLTKWIDQGAKFDGKDPTQVLKELVGPGVTTNMAMQEKAGSDGRHRQGIGPLLARHRSRAGRSLPRLPRRRRTIPAALCGSTRSTGC